MQSEEAIRERLERLEQGANQYEDVYHDNYEAIFALRWILGMEKPPPRIERYDD